MPIHYFQDITRKEYLQLPEAGSFPIAPDWEPPLSAKLRWVSNETYFESPPPPEAIAWVVAPVGVDREDVRLALLRWARRLGNQA